MPYMTYPYQLPPLPYPYESLEPVISAETLHYHHDKHFQAYINGLNEALRPYPYLQNQTLEQLLSTPTLIPIKARKAVLHNGGGVYNHFLYFNGLAPANTSGHTPQGQLLEMINHNFGSFTEFKNQFNQTALSVFGSGWCALVILPGNKLQIVKLANQDTLLTTSAVPLLYVDVWEHSYYLDYKNERNRYLELIWNLLLFPELSL